MASRGTLIRQVDHLKRWPIFYSVIRGISRGSKTVLRELARNAGSSPQFGAAKGFYSGVEQLREGCRIGGITVEAQQLPSLPIPSLIKESGLGQDGGQPWPIFWLRETNACLVSDSLALMDQKKRLMAEEVGGDIYCHSDQAYTYIWLPKEIELTGSWTSLVSRWSGGFYHWLMDELPRLALVNEFPQQTQILVRGPLTSYQCETLRMLGCLDRVRETQERHLLLEEYYFTSPVGATGCVNPYAIRWLRENLLPHASDGETPRRFVVIRRRKTRGIINQQELIDLFTSSGWAVVDLEDLTMAQQIAWFHNAEAIVAEHGAGLTNLLWCRSNCRVLELCAHNFLNGCYEGIAITLGLQHEYRIFPANNESSMHVDSQLIVQWLSDQGLQ